MIKERDKRRVVVTGLGVVSSIGIGWQEFWKNLLAGKSGISKITAFDTSPYDRHYGGEIKGFDATQFAPRKIISKMGRTSQLAYVASLLALEDAGLDMATLQKKRVGLFLGTTLAEAQVVEAMVTKAVNAGEEEIPSMWPLNYPAFIIPTYLANLLKLQSPALIFTTACSASNYSIGYAFDAIKSGKVNIALVGGSESLSRLAFTGFARLFAMAPEKCQPFDKDRKGMVLGEGSGILLLESLENAQLRKAPIYAEITGYGFSSDVHHMTTPSIRGVSKAMEKAMTVANIKQEEVGYINAHGTGTKENDKVESAAIHAVFGDYTPNILVSSIKSMLGHSLGASSALEGISCCLTVLTGKVPPTINVEELDGECNINCVIDHYRLTDIKCALNNSLAFGGNNFCVVFRRFA